MNNKNNVIQTVNNIQDFGVAATNTGLYTIYLLVQLNNFANPMNNVNTARAVRSFVTIYDSVTTNSDFDNLDIQNPPDIADTGVTGRRQLLSKLSGPIAKVNIKKIDQLWKGINFNWPIKGYFHWTLVDNFEWERGWTQRFGLWELDTETQGRRKRPSADLFKLICSENCLSSEMVEKYAPHIYDQMFPSP